MLVRFYFLICCLSIGLSKTNLNAAAKESTAILEHEEIASFNPPSSWRYADTSDFKHIKIMVIGQGKHAQPPSITLAIGTYGGTLKEYIKTIVKPRNDLASSEWKDLGAIQTEAGRGNLVQYDRRTKWGNERVMQLLLVKEGHVYIMTASAIKEEFARFYKDFFTSIRSFRISKDIFDTIKDSNQRKKIKESIQHLKQQWQTMLANERKSSNEMPLDKLKSILFESQQFQKNVWLPFKATIQNNYQIMGTEWQNLVLQLIENQLFELNP